MTRNAVHFALALLAAAQIAVSGAYATDGMNMEGYGPVATAMGGASMAQDNGTAAVMNNPATLGLIPEGVSRLDIAIGYLGPDVASDLASMSLSSSSSATAFYMPAAGWVMRRGAMAYGVGVFAQGGMGTEYGGTSFLAAGSGETVRSEVSVGRLLLPFAYNVSPRLALGATADFVWAGMDLRMALSGAQFADLATPGQQVFGEASGTLVNTFGGFIGQGLGVNHARFDFSNDSDFTGEAMGYGGAVKLGAVYRVREDLTLGAAFHSKTALGDLETDDAGVAMNVNATAFGMPASVPMELVGKISVRDFEWPHTAALGAAWQATDALLLAADYKWIGWSGVMKDFKMTFTASDAASNDFTAAFGPGADLRGQSMDAVLYQEWEDEHVLMLGGAYTISRPLTVRAGVNVATNPIPDEYVNPLFPAIVTNHVTLGAGWAFSEKGSVDLSLTVAPKSTATNPGFAAGGDEVEISHSQTNAQIMYSRRF